MKRCVYFLVFFSVFMSGVADGAKKKKEDLKGGLFVGLEIIKDSKVQNLGVDSMIIAEPAIGFPRDSRLHVVSWSDIQAITGDFQGQEAQYGVRVIVITLKSGEYWRLSIMDDRRVDHLLPANSRGQRNGEIVRDLLDAYRKYGSGEGVELENQPPGWESNIVRE